MTEMPPRIDLQIELDRIRVMTVQHIVDHNNIIKGIVSKELERLLSLSNLESAIPEMVERQFSEALRKHVHECVNYKAREIAEKMVLDKIWGDAK